MLSLRLPLAAALLSCLTPAQATDPGPNHWTILVYGCQDNDSEQSFCPDIAALREGLVQGPGVEVFCLVDRSPEYSSSTRGFGEDFADTRLYRLTREAAVRVDGGEQLPQITTDSVFEADTGDAATLRQYLRWAKAHHPAEHYALIFYSHGNGVLWCPDEATNTQLAPAELTDVLEERDSLDLVVFDVCSMAGAENAYQWRPGAGKFSIDVMVATPMAGFPFPWRNILSRIRPGDPANGEARWYDPAELTAAQFGNLVVEETEKHRRDEIESNDHHADMVRAAEREAMTCLDLRAAERVKLAADALARELARDDDGKLTVQTVRGTDRDAQTLHYSALYFDLFEFARRVEQTSLSETVAARAGQLREAVDALVLSSYGLDKYDEFGGFEPGVHGVYVVLPDGEASPGRRSEFLQWYAPERLTGDPRFYGHLAWCRDGAEPGNDSVDNWFELLDCWYDSGKEGGRNGYHW